MEDSYYMNYTDPHLLPQWHTVFQHIFIAHIANVINTRVYTLSSVVAMLTIAEKTCTEIKGSVIPVILQIKGPEKTYTEIQESRTSVALQLTAVCGQTRCEKTYTKREDPPILLILWRKAVSSLDRI